MGVKSSETHFSNFLFVLALFYSCFFFSFCLKAVHSLFDFTSFCLFAFRTMQKFLAYSERQLTGIIPYELTDTTRGMSRISGPEFLSGFFSFVFFFIARPSQIFVSLFLFLLNLPAPPPPACAREHGKREASVVALVEPASNGRFVLPSLCQRVLLKWPAN